MKISLFKKRYVPAPTLAGCSLILLLLGAPVIWWFFCGESFFCLTERQPAETLAVEGWIGIDGIRAAKAEFEQGGYRNIVTVGGLSGNPWDSVRWNYANEAAELLVRLGVPPEKVIAAPAPDLESHRTFGAAAVAAKILKEKLLVPINLNVFTSHSHARRSRLVFEKAFPSSTHVGVISWTPSRYHDEPWWRSSERALDLIKETVGYLFELLLNSGRFSSHPTDLQNQASQPAANSRFKLNKTSLAGFEMQSPSPAKRVVRSQAGG